MQQQYPIGTPGTPWGKAERAAWLAQQQRQRSYHDDVVKDLESLGRGFQVTQYGELDYAGLVQQTYPLFIVRSANESPEKPYILVTGGVHGYETSGVHGALQFLKVHAEQYHGDFNFVVVPCLSPWGYETINRWNPHAVDPNRSFISDRPAQESALLMDYLDAQGIDFLAHIDLHETTDSDNSEFRPALAAREGTTNHNWNIPDGFYLVADSERRQDEFQAAIVKRVEQVTHIAEPDAEEKLIGAELCQRGVIEYPAKSLGLCMGLTHAAFVTTTEVYPDSSRATPELCIEAQVAAIRGAIDFLR